MWKLELEYLFQEISRIFVPRKGIHKWDFRCCVGLSISERRKPRSGIVKHNYSVVCRTEVKLQD
jgi:hypothetical protein